MRRDCPRPKETSGNANWERSQSERPRKTQDRAKNTPSKPGNTYEPFAIRNQTSARRPSGTWEHSQINRKKYKNSKTATRPGRGSKHTRLASLFYQPKTGAPSPENTCPSPPRVGPPTVLVVRALQLQTDPGALLQNVAGMERTAEDLWTAVQDAAGIVSRSRALCGREVHPIGARLPSNNKHELNEVRRRSKQRCLRVEKREREEQLARMVEDERVGGCCMVF